MVKVTAERLPDAQVVLNIEVEPEKVEQATQRAYQSIVNRVNIPGFRRGKAPRPIVERFIGGAEALKQEGLERLIPEVYRDAVKEAELEPIDQPELEVVSVEPLVVKATVSVQPEVEVGDYKSIRLAKVPVEVPYERINETIERVRDQRTTWEPVKRPAKAGDRIVADVSGTIGAAPTLFDAKGEPLAQTEGGETLFDQKNAEIEIDPANDQPVPGFHKQLVGLKAKGEKRFTLSLPADWPNEEQRSRTVLFHVAVDEVKQAKVPALDDEFAKSVGEYENLDALREDIRARLREQLEHEAEHLYEDQVVSEAVKAARIEVPPALVRRETERLVANFERNLARQRLSLDQYLKLTSKSPEELREELRPSAESNVRSFLVLREIGKVENVEVSPEEIDAEVERIAQLMGGDDVEQAREMLSRPDEREDIQANLWHRKVLDRLKEIAQSTEQAAPEATQPEVQVSEPTPSV